VLVRVQVPPFWQGLSAHSSTATLQVVPVRPDGQEQVKLPVPWPSKPPPQVPPYWQGLGLQSSGLMTVIVVEAVTAVESWVAPRPIVKV